jgi:Copper type II ascorbate-dependent monooxygenase, C-terminal domain
MHRFGSKIVVRRISEDQKRECLLEIPKWEFGWEQPYWFAEEKPLGPNDELYIECHFDNSAENQHSGAAPRDFAWGGNNQDMCVAFLSFTQ